MADDDFRHESVQDPRSIVRYLQAITAGIERGHIQLGVAEHLLDLHPTGMLELEVQARRKGGRVKLALELHWRETDDQDPTSSALTITVD
ncbi:amphi-Trp domain-containing protein [Nannocystaceae bacterium ST9]